jgi:hypothetical protein
MPKGLSLKDIADRVRRGVDITGAKILTVLDMGSGNGLDADTVDGLEAAAFATASHTHVEADITDLDKYTQAEVDAKTWTTSDITDLSSYTGLDVRYYTETETDNLLDDKADLETTFNNQTGTTYTAVLSDSDKMITMNNAAANTLTIPANASVAYPVGTRLNIMQLGAGATTVAITTDTLSVNSNLTLVLNGQYAVATALKTGSTTWVLFGNLVPA